MDARRTPSASWYGVAGFLAFASLVAAVAWGLGSYQQLQDRLEALPRTAVPGTIVVAVGTAQSVTVFYEDPVVAGGFAVQASGTSKLRAAPVELTVTDASQRPVATTPYGTDLRFDIGDRVAIASATFDAPAAGHYTVEVAGDVPAQARVSAGTVVDAELIASAIGVVTLFVMPLLAVVVVAVVVAVRGARTPLPPTLRSGA